MQARGGDPHVGNPVDRPSLDAPELHERVREVAFALLMTRRRPVSADDIAAFVGLPAARLASLVDELTAAGWIDRDRSGEVTGSAGLSLTDGPHRLSISGAEFRNWCAYDSLGIAAAMRADATIDTACPVCGTPVRIRVSAGEPPATASERLWLAEGGTDLRKDFCAPTVLLCSADHAGAWAEQHGGRGRAVDLVEAARLGGEAWSDCARAVAEVESLSA